MHHCSVFDGEWHVTISINADVIVNFHLTFVSDMLSLAWVLLYQRHNFVDPILTPKIVCAASLKIKMAIALPNSFFVSRCFFRGQRQLPILPT